MRFGQDPQCAGYHQMPAFGLGAPGLFIDQETAGVYGEGQRDGHMLAGIQEAKGRVGGRVRPDLTPARRLRDPYPYSGGRVRVLQLRGNRFRHEHASVEGANTSTAPISTR